MAVCTPGVAGRGLQCLQSALRTGQFDVDVVLAAMGKKILTHAIWTLLNLLMIECEKFSGDLYDGA